MNIFELFALVSHNYENVEKWDSETFWRGIIAEDDLETVANKIYFGNYNPFHDYIGFDGYGNIESMSAYDYEEELLSYAGELIREALYAGEIDEDEAKELAEQFGVEI